MRDLVIKSSQIRKELFSLLICFIISFLCNVGAVLYYKADTLELISSLPYVVVFAFFLYAVWAAFRLLKNGVLYLIRKR
jgi:glucan phosphoethanolaminetransferase (alkaline phosphatase superfamily)